MDHNDVFFSLHAVALTLVILVQCFLYEVRLHLAPTSVDACPGPQPSAHATHDRKAVDGHVLTDLPGTCGKHPGISAFRPFRSRVEDRKRNSEKSASSTVGAQAAQEVLSLQE